MLDAIKHYCKAITDVYLKVGRSFNNLWIASQYSHKMAIGKTDAIKDRVVLTSIFDYLLTLYPLARTVCQSGCLTRYFATKGQRGANV